MRFRFVSFLILMSLPCLALAATTQPVHSEKEQKAQVQAEIIADMQDKPFLGEKDLSEIINFSIVDGRLFPSTPSLVNAISALAERSSG